MRRGTLVIGVLIVLVLLPMWYVGIQGEATSTEIAIDQSVSDIQPLDGPIDVPIKLSPSQVGVIVWIALLGLYGVLVGAHRFMNTAVRPTGDDTDTVASDGGYAGDNSGSKRKGRTDGGVRTPSWLTSKERWLVEYHDATCSFCCVVWNGHCIPTGQSK